MRSTNAESQLRCAIGITAAILFLSVVLKLETGESRRYDFAHLYTAGMMIRGGAAAQLYDLAAQKRWQERSVERPGLMPFLSPAVLGLVGLPLSLLNYRLAWIIFGALNIGLWITFASLTRQLSGLAPFQHLAACFCFFPLWVALDTGQVSIIFLLLFTLAFLAFQRGEDFNAGVLAGLGLFRFQLVLPLTAVMVLRRQWRALTGIVIPVAAYVILSFAIVGADGLRAHFRLLSYMAAHPEISPAEEYAMPSLRAVFSIVGLPPLAVNALAFLCAAALVIAIVIRWPAVSLERSYAALFIVTVITAAHVYVYDLGLVLLAILLIGFHDAKLRIASFALLLYPLPAFFLSERYVWPAFAIPLAVFVLAILYGDKERQACGWLGVEESLAVGEASEALRSERWSKQIGQTRNEESKARTRVAASRS
jgi:hypothetical protein